MTGFVNSGNIPPDGSNLCQHEKRKQYLLCENTSHQLHISNTCQLENLIVQMHDA